MGAVALLGGEASWRRDFAALGAGCGAIAPNGLGVLLYVFDGVSEPVVFLAFISLGCAAFGALVGTLVGQVLFHLARWGSEYPLTLFPAGFPLGAVPGTVAGLIATTQLPYGATLQETWIIASIPMIAGGLVLGGAWVPYLALRRLGRPGWPVLLGMSLLSPFVGILAFASVGMVVTGLREVGLLF